MSYLAPPSRHHSRIHTRDKVLTPFRSRSSSGDRDTSQTASIQTVTDTSSEQTQQLAWNSSQLEQTDTSVIDTDNYHMQMASKTSHAIPIIVESFDNKRAKFSQSSAASSVSAATQIWPSTTSSPSTLPPAAAATTTAPMPASKIWSAAELTSQHHQANSYNPASAVMTPNQAQPQPLNPASSPASPPVNARPSRLFSPTSPAPSVVDSRPWSPQSESGVSSLKFVPGSQQPPVHKFTPAQRSLSPPINPTLSAGVVRVPYIPTPAVSRSSSVGASARVQPPSPRDHEQLATPPSPSSLSFVSAPAADSVAYSYNHPVNNAMMTTTHKAVSATPEDMRPFSPTTRYTSDHPTGQPPGYRRVAVPNPNLINTISTNDHQLPGIMNNQDQYVGVSPIRSLSNDGQSATGNFVPNSSDLQEDSLQRGHMTQNPQRSDVNRPFSPDISNVGDITSFFSVKNDVHQTVEETRNASQKPNVPSFHQPQQPNYQMSEPSTISHPAEARPFSPRTSQMPSKNYQSPVVNYQQPTTSIVSDMPQSEPFSPQTSQMPPVSYQTYPIKSETYTNSSRSQARPQTNQLQSNNYQSPAVNYQQPGTSIISDTPQNRPFSPQTGQMPSVGQQEYQINYHQYETATTTVGGQALPLSPQTSQVSVKNYQTVPVNYKQPEVSATLNAPQGQPFSPQGNQMPSVSYQGHPVNYYQQSETSTKLGSLQARPFSPQASQMPWLSYQGYPVNQQQSETSTKSGTSQTRPFSPQVNQVQSNIQSHTVNYQQPGIGWGSPQSRQVPSVNYDTGPLNYQQPGMSTKSNTSQGQPLSPPESHRPDMSYQAHPVNFQQPETSMISHTPRGRPFSPQANQTPAVGYQASPVNQQPGSAAVPRPPQPKSVGTHIGVKQHVQRFSTPTNAQVKNSYPQQQLKQQYAVRPQAPAVTSHDADSVHGQERTFSARDNRLVQPPTDNFTASKMGIPITRQASHKSNVNAPRPLDQQFSPVATPTIQQHYLPATVPASQTHNADEIRRPFIPPARVNTVTPAQANVKLTQNTNVPEQPHGEPRSRPKYPNDSRLIASADSSSFGLTNDNRPFSPPGDRTGRQQVYSPVTSPTAASRDNFFGPRKEIRPFSPASDHPAIQPANHPVASPAVASVDSYDGNIMENRFFSPSAEQGATRQAYHLVTSPAGVDGSVDKRTDIRPFSPPSAADRALSQSARPFSPSVSSTSLQRPSSAPSSGVSSGKAGDIQGYRRICFSPVPQPVHPSQRSSPIPLMISEQPAVSAAAKDARISVSGARLAFTPRRGSDVTALNPSYLTSTATRTQLNVLRENQVADWKDSRKPIVWTPPTASSGRSQSLEPVSDTPRGEHLHSAMHGCKATTENYTLFYKDA